MKRGVERNFIILFSLIFILGLSLAPIVSASWFDDTWNKMTGKVVSNSGSVQLNSFNSPWDQYNARNNNIDADPCRQPPKLISAVTPGDTISVSGVSGSLCARLYPRYPMGRCINNANQGCSVPVTLSSSLFDSTVRVGFYDNNNNLIKEYALRDLQNGIKVPVGATQLYAYEKESCGINSACYFDNNGAYTITFNYAIKPACVPATCSSIGKNCGTVDDSCGAQINCGNCDGGQVCTDGACVATATCSDSDGGENYGVKGKATWGNSGIAEDSCRDDNRLDEAICHEDGIGGTIDYTCPNGCSDGACKKGIKIFSKYTMINRDSEQKVEWEIYGLKLNTVNIYLKGGLSDIKTYTLATGIPAPQGYYAWKVPADAVSGKYQIIIQYADWQGISDSFEIVSSTCTDSDTSLNNFYYVKGVVIDSSGEGSFTDYCSQDTIIEYYCHSYECPAGRCIRADYLKYVCPTGCYDGACVSPASTCSDSDGGKDYSKKGIVKWVPLENPTLHTAEDKCGAYIDGIWHPELLDEHYCVDNTWAHGQFSCPNGCSDGACLPEDNITSCSDSDGGKNAYTKGTITGASNLGGDYAIKEFTDTCHQGDNGTYYVMEGVCLNNDLNEYHQTIIDCPNGCTDGACVNSDTKYIIPQDFGILNYNGYNTLSSSEDHDLSDIFEGLEFVEGESAAYREVQVAVVKYSDIIKYNTLMGFVSSKLSNYQLDFDPAGSEYEGVSNAQILFAQSKESNNQGTFVNNYFIWTKGDLLIIGSYGLTSEEFEDFDVVVGPDYINLLKVYLNKYPSELVIEASSNATCSDTDGGVVIDLFGKTLVKIGDSEYKNEDSCALVSGYDFNGKPIGWQSTSSCSGKDCYIEEAFCRTDNNGNVIDADADELFSCESGCSDGACVEKKVVCDNGCILKDKCVDPGYRFEGEYCDINGKFLAQNKANGECENNFECDSNLCINSKCVSGTAWQKFLNWFSRLFGRK